MKLASLTVGVVLALSSAVVGMTGCASAADDAAKEGSYGTVAMSLTGQTNGTTYRLRNALFDVDGPTRTLLDSELDPDASLIATTLPTGAYTAALASGWVLQRLDAGGFQVVEAALVSANPASFQISNAATTSLVFTFETNGQIVEIGTGTLALSIAVVETSVGADCDILAQTGCSAGLACYFTADGSDVACLAPGVTAPGDACEFQNDCAAPGVCASADSGATSQCFQACAPDGSGTVCPGAQSCLELIAGLGVCF